MSLPTANFPRVRRLPLVQVLRGHLLFSFILSLWVLTLSGGFIFDSLLAWSAGVLYIAYDTWLLAFVAWQTRNLAGAGSAPAVSNCPLTLAVPVPGRNEHSVLPGCIDALLAQTSVPEELWIIDDGSTDGTAEMLKQRYGVDWVGGAALGQSPQIPVLRVWRKPHSGKASSLNEVWPMTATDLVVTIDADTLCAPTAIAAMRAAFARDPSLAAACGMLRPRCGRGWSARVFEWFQVFEYLRAFLARAAWMRADALLLVSGALAGYRREVLQKLGGFDVLSLVEDYELIHRLHRYAAEHGLRWSVAVVVGARAVTDAPASLGSFLQQRRRWFAGFLETQFANSDMAGNRRYGAVGRLMLPIKAVDTLQPLYGLTAFILLTVFVLDWRPVALPVLVLIAGKLVVDFAYHLWALHHYYRWLDERPGLGVWLRSMLATLAEPFSFQLMRHTGAALGWVSFLRGSVDWTPQRSTQVPRSCA